MPSRRRLLVLSLMLAYSPAAMAQGADDDDLLTPLAPAAPGEVKSKRKRKKVTPPAVDRRRVPRGESAARLQVNLADPSMRNARLFLDGQEMGVLPLGPLAAAPGEHTVVVKRPGYAPYSATARVKPGGVTEMTVSLEPVGGVLNVTSEVVGAEVFVDGVSRGPVPVNDVVLAPGDHLLSLRRDGYEEQSQTIAVEAGRDYNVRLNLAPLPVAVARTDRPERPPRLEPLAPGVSPAENAGATRVERDPGGAAATPWYGQWYVWAGGAAVGAGAALGVWAMRPQSPCGARACDACINAPPAMRQFCPALMRLPLVGFGGPVGP